MLRQFRSANGQAMYIDPSEVVAVSQAYPAEKCLGHPLPYREIYLRGGAALVVEDSPELMEAVVDSVTSNS